MPLTDTAVRAAKPQVQARKLFDGGGLYLEVSPFPGHGARPAHRPCFTAVGAVPGQHEAAHLTDDARLGPERTEI